MCIKRVITPAWQKWALRLVRDTSVGSDNGADSCIRLRADEETTPTPRSTVTHRASVSLPLFPSRLILSIMQMTFLFYFHFCSDGATWKGY